MNKTYSFLNSLDTFKKRFEYLKLNGRIGESTFGHSRYLNQELYRSYEWKKTRRQIILRDNGCDLGLPGREIYGRIYIHHLNPITLEDVVNRNPIIFDPDNLVCVSQRTHEAIHYGDETILQKDITSREENDTCPWRKQL